MEKVTDRDKGCKRKRQQGAECFGRFKAGLGQRVICLRCRFCGQRFAVVNLIFAMPVENPARILFAPGLIAFRRQMPAFLNELLGQGREIHDRSIGLLLNLHGDWGHGRPQCCKGFET